jgi:hypothetical protein
MDQGTFPRAGNTENGQRLTPGDDEIQVFQDLDCAAVLYERFA